MSANLITLADFADYVPFSAQIGAHLVDPHIRDAQTFDVWPLLPAALRTALMDTAPAPPEEEVFIVSLQVNDGPVVPNPEARGVPDPIAPPATGDVPAFFADYIRPLLVVSAARRLLLWHGLHITPNGAEITVAQPISGAQRTELRADLEAKAAHYRARLEAALRLRYPSAGTACSPGVRRRAAGGLRTSAV